MITIVGAGPVGNYLAYLLARHGKEVSVYEEHKKIGLPVHCTGIVTSKFCRIIRPVECVINEIRRARIYSPDQNYLELHLKPNLILDRARLELYLAAKARLAGAEFHLGHKFINSQNNSLLFRAKSGLVRTRTDYLVGADGPLSAVAKTSGLFKNKRFFVGIQARANLKNDNAVEFYLNKEDFGWVVPESRDRVRIGILARHNPHEALTAFLKQRLGPNYKDEILEYQGGLVPLFNPRVRTRKGTTYLVGDAAGMVKATTGGGLVLGLLGAGALSESLIKNQDYEKKWQKKIGTELLLALKMRMMMDCFSEKDYNLLIRLMNKKGFRTALEQYDRDSLTSLLPRLVFETIKEPRFIHFAKILFKRNLYI